MKTIVEIVTLIRMLMPIIMIVMFLYTIEVWKDIEHSRIMSNEMIEAYKKTGAWG